jgi:hypothetical protein
MARLNATRLPATSASVRRAVFVASSSSPTPPAPLPAVIVVRRQLPPAAENALGFARTGLWQTKLPLRAFDDHTAPAKRLQNESVAEAAQRCSACDIIPISSCLHLRAAPNNHRVFGIAILNTQALLRSISIPCIAIL